MALKIYNTLSRQKEELPDPKEQKKIKLFVCGPTVYDYPHIGHARTYIFFDFFAKYLRSLGYEVEYLQNITDVDDKIIKRAQKSGKRPSEIADLYAKAYRDDMATLGVDAVTKYAPATDHIKEIIEQVNRLIDKGFAYEIEGDGWYFDISKFQDYGKLSGRTVEQAEDAVSRIDEAVGKRNKGDFCLWKFSKEDEPTWKSDLGDGRPGWHIEDTAITEHFFGPQYDIHGGGVDVKFPHHEAEIAQQRTASGKEEFVKIWMHTGALLVGGKKMSKSLGNFITIRDFLKKHPPEVLRWITLTHHYRSPVDYSEEVAQQAKTAINNVGRFLAQLDFSAKYSSERGRTGVEFAKTGMEKGFNTALSDDINTPLAIADIHDGIAKIQKKVWTFAPENAEGFSKYLKEKFNTLSFSFKSPEIPKKIQKMAEEREQFRVNKQFNESDRLRKEIEGLGYEIEDTPLGPFIWPKPSRE